MDVTTAACGNAAFATFAIAAGASPVAGEEGPTTSEAETRESSMVSLPMVLFNVAVVCSTVSSGRMRQLTMASADVGRTFSWGAALSMVVTHVVRTRALN